MTYTDNSAYMTRLRIKMSAVSVFVNTHTEIKPVMAGSNLIKTKILQRIDSEENWNTKNPVLSSAELVFTRANGGVFMKIGDGRAYSDTPFIQKMTVDGEMVSSLAVAHVSMLEYSAMLRDGTTDSNTAYVISSDPTDMCCQQIKNVAEGTDLSDAVNVKQLQNLSSQMPSAVSQLDNDAGYLSSIPSSYKAYEATISSLSADGYALKTDIPSATDISTEIGLSDYSLTSHNHDGTYLKEVPDAYKTYEATLSSLSSDGYALSSVVHAEIGQKSSVTFVDWEE